MLIQEALLSTCKVDCICYACLHTADELLTQRQHHLAWGHRNEFAAKVRFESALSWPRKMQFSKRHRAYFLVFQHLPYVEGEIIMLLIFRSAWKERVTDQRDRHTLWQNGHIFLWYSDSNWQLLLEKRAGRKRKVIAELRGWYNPLVWVTKEQWPGTQCRFTQPSRNVYSVHLFNEKTVCLAYDLFPGKYRSCSQVCLCVCTK